MKVFLITVGGVGASWLLFSNLKDKEIWNTQSNSQSNSREARNAQFGSPDSRTYEYVDGDLLAKLRFACLEENKPRYVFHEETFDDVDCELVGFNAAVNMCKKRSFINMEIVKSEYPSCNITVDFSVHDSEGTMMFQTTEVTSCFTVEDAQ